VQGSGPVLALALLNRSFFSEGRQVLGGPIMIPSFERKTQSWGLFFRRLETAIPKRRRTAPSGPGFGNFARSTTAPLLGVPIPARLMSPSLENAQS